MGPEATAGSMLSFLNKIGIREPEREETIMAVISESPIHPLMARLVVKVRSFKSHI